MALSDLGVALASRSPIVALMERFVRRRALSQGAANRNAVALTFDDGPHPVWTPEILDRLDMAGVRGTFFVVGRYARAHPGIVRDARRRGHEIGTHLDSHELRTVDDPARFRQEIRRSTLELESLLGEPIRWLRFPYGRRGRIDPREVYREYGVRTVHWTYSSHDSREPDPRRIVARVAAGLRAGAIVLFHDRLADGSLGLRPPYRAERDATVAALPGVFRELAARGLDGVTVGELLVDRPARD
jgi:peptidoglycan/xylan/chitin deacetylase (PgdA/CDA1 family)